MATENRIDFKVRVTDEGLAPLAGNLDKVESKTEELGKSATTTGQRIDGMGDAASTAGKQTDDLGDRAGNASRLLGEMAASLAAAFTFREMVAAAAQMEQIQAGLQAVAGDSTLAGEQMEFVRRMATAAGVDVTAAGQAFLGLAAATKGTAVEGEPARQVFESVTLAMAKAGKSSAETQNALLALSQIASKGTVSMEELRGQLGEALPGALQAASSGLGITTQDLIKLVENGQLAAEDLFPALAKGLDELYGGAPAAQTLSQEITNIKNAFVEMSANLGESGGLDALKVGAELAQMAITLLGDTLIQTGQYIGTLAGAVATLDFSGLSEAFAQIEKDSRDRLLKAAEHNDTLRNALVLSSDAAIQAALAQREHGKAAADAGGQNAAAAPGVAALGVAYAKVREEIQTHITLAEKEIEAVKARGQAAIAQAAGLGDEEAKRKAIAVAAAQEAAAMETLADIKRTELGVLQAELGARQALMGQSGQDSEQRKKEVAELEKLIAQKQIDVDKTTAQAAASREKAKANSEEVQAAQAAISAAQALSVARSADAKVALSGLQTQKELARQAEEMARLMGDEVGVRQARIQQIEIEIQIVKARANVAKVEAEGSIAVAQAKMAELKASGQLTPLKEAEINAAIKLAQAKIAEANANGKSTEILEKHLEAMRNGVDLTNAGADAANRMTDAQGNMAGATDQATSAMQRQNAEREAAISAQEKELELKQREIDLENKRRGVDREGFSTDKSGNRLAMGGDLTTLTGIANFLKGAGLDDEQAKTLAREFADSKGDIPYLSNPGQMKYGGQGSTMSQALLKAAERTTFGLGNNGSVPIGGSSTPSKTVNVKIDGGRGRRETVNTDEAGAAALVRSLETAAGRSGLR